MTTTEETARPETRWNSVDAINHPGKRHATARTFRVVQEGAEYLHRGPGLTLREVIAWHVEPLIKDAAEYTDGSHHDLVIFDGASVAAVVRMWSDGQGTYRVIELDTWVHHADDPMSVDDENYPPTFDPDNMPPRCIESVEKLREESASYTSQGHSADDLAEPEPGITDRSIRIEKRLAASELKVHAEAYLAAERHYREVERLYKATGAGLNVCKRASETLATLRASLVGDVLDHWYANGFEDHEWEPCGLRTGGAPDLFVWVEPGLSVEGEETYDVDRAEVKVMDMEGVDALVDKDD
jgi:hypothetical protein